MVNSGNINFLPLRLNPRGGRQTGIPVYQVLKGVSLIKVKEVGEMSLYSASRDVSMDKR